MSILFLYFFDILLFFITKFKNTPPSLLSAYHFSNNAILKVFGVEVDVRNVTIEVFTTYGKNVLSKYLSYLSSYVLSSLFLPDVIK